MVAGKGLLLGLFAFAAWGQTSEKVFYFAHLNAPQAMQEVANVVRSVGDIRDVSPDVAQRSLTVKGTADQIAAAAWLTAELDKPGGATGTRDFPFNDARSPLAQVAYLRYVDTPQEMQEVVNAIRAMVDIQRFFPMNQQKAIVMRGTAEQVKAADWLLGVLDRPAGAQPDGTAPSDYRLPQEDWNARSGLVVRVAFLTHLDTPQAVQEVTNVTRSIADIQRCFPVYSRRVLVMRGDDDRMALADWLLKQFDGPTGQGTKEFKMGGVGGQMVQVVFVNAATPQSLQETVNTIRTDTKMQRVYPFQTQKAVAMRGTADQLAQAQQAIQSRQGK
jgi:phage host-nuclease inhibitor protein Gam